MLSANRTAGGGGRGVVPAVAPCILQHLVRGGSAAARRRVRNWLHTYGSSRHQFCRLRSDQCSTAAGAVQLLEDVDECELSALLMNCNFISCSLDRGVMPKLQVVSTRRRYN
jgi:hypothetical protein